jgi:predicted Rossmann fold nucleotide-binding protein DprA/Smf involved in DNA uptake
MPETPNVGAIAQQIKARIKHVEEQLRQNDKLTDELERLRGALSRLEGAARSRVRPGGRGREPVVEATGRSSGATRAKAARAPARAPRGQNKAKVMEALKGGPMTASEIAKVTGVGTGTVSTMLTKMAKTGEVAKAERGYKLPN